MSNSAWPHRWQPIRLPRPWDSPGKNTGVGCHFLLPCMKVKSEKWKWSRSVMSDSVRPHGLQPTGSSIPGILQATVLEWVPLPSPMTNLDRVLKSRDITLLSKGSSAQDFCFSCSHVWMWELDHKESWAPKNRCFQTVVLKKTFGSLLDCKEVKPVHPKGNQSWIFIGRTDDEAEAPVLWPPNRKNWLWKIPWCWERLKAGGEGGNRGWDGWMASPTQWTWI